MILRFLLLSSLLLATLGVRAADLSLFDQKNLAAWCIVPFDKAKRGPEERAAMLEKLGFTKFVYDYRPEHVPTFEAELEALKRHHIELMGWWFPTTLNDEAKMTLALFKKHNVHPQLWVNGGGEMPKSDDERRERIAKEVERIKPIAEAAQAQGLKVGLYNHGGWFGEPETQLAIIEALGMNNVGMVYNLHHGHDHMKRFPSLLQAIKPHLLCLNLNGMMTNGDKQGMKIMPIGQGELDLRWAKVISESGYTGPIGILNHTDEDAEARLKDNLDGLQWVVKQLRDSPDNKKPTPRSWTMPAKPAAKAGTPQAPGGEPSLSKAFGLALRGPFSAGEKEAYRTRPFTIECRARLDSKSAFNILVARDPKASADHWELYTYTGSGQLALFQPGRGGNVRGTTDVCDGKWHRFAAIVEDTRVRLYVDGKLEAEGAARPMQGEVKPGGLAFGSLVEHGIGCDGLLDDARLSKGVREIAATADQPLTADEQTLELWSFDGLPPVKAAAAPPPEPAEFFYEFQPLKPELWPNRTHPVNHYRLYDFYTKEALAFKGRTPPALLPAFPGLEGGLFGHWGFADDETWKDNRWNEAERKPVQAGILHTPLGHFPKAVVVQLGDHDELTSFFDPLTLNFPAATAGGFVKLADIRHGFSDGLRFNAPLQQKMVKPAPDKPFTYHGYYRHGNRVVFSYTLDGRRTLDSAWAEGSDFTRITCPEGVAPLAQWTKGGPAQWPQWLESRGELGSRQPYALDTLPLPKHPAGHPWFLSGHDFFNDGSIAFCTMTGDVWIVRGVDEKLEHLRWKRFAAGLSEPLGLRVVDGKICVQCRDQITRLHDLNGDDEADFYECVTNAQDTSPGGHDFITGCEYDGTFFYYASGNQGICRVKPGSAPEVLATGLRNPNGLGLSRDGIVTSNAQEGDWTPASMICEVKAGRFFGHGGPSPEHPEVSPPLLWLPRGLDNSCGGECFTQSDRWGPLGGQLIHFSPGAANHFLILRQQIGDVTQGAAVWLPGDFLSGAQQGRISPHDGQLYVSGMYGWGCWGRDDGCLQRVRYTGGPAHLPMAFEAHENGVLIRFSDPLGPEAKDVTKHFAQCWNYRYSAAYGSPEFSVRHPNAEGHDPLPISSAQVLEEGRALFLEIPLLTPCHQVHLHVATIGEAYQDLYLTVHALAPDFTAFPGYVAKKKERIVPDESAVAITTLENPYAKGQPGRTLNVQAVTGFHFQPAELHAKAGERLSLTFTNPDVAPHNWVLIAPDQLHAVGDLANRLIADPKALARHYVPESTDVLAWTNLVNPGTQFTIHFNAPKAPGRYPFLCSFPGHWLVMNGALVVE